MKLIIANWKLNPHLWTDASKLLEEIHSHSTDKTVVICPPSIYIPLIKSHFHLGAQDIHWEHSGAHTGQISAPMVKQFQVKYVLIGHSELRNLWQKDEHINKKIKAALDHDLIPILCIGSKSSNEEEVIADLNQQLLKNLHEIDTTQVIIAYEPIWAIGSGQSATPEHLEKITQFIRAKYQTKSIIYGGSVNAENSAHFLKITDGLLVGGASLKTEEFKKILKA